MSRRRKIHLDFVPESDREILLLSSLSYHASDIEISEGRSYPISVTWLFAIIKSLKVKYESVDHFVRFVITMLYSSLSGSLYFIGGGNKDCNRPNHPLKSVVGLADELLPADSGANTPSREKNSITAWKLVTYIDWQRLSRSVLLVSAVDVAGERGVDAFSMSPRRLRHSHPRHLYCFLRVVAPRDIDTCSL